MNVRRLLRGQRCTLAALTVVVALTLLPPLAAQPVVFSGRVRTGAAEHPVPGALVEVPSLRLRTRTDSLGRFRLRAVPDGAHTVAVRVIGFDPWLGNGVPRAGTDLGLLQAFEVLGVEFHSAATVPAQYNATQASPCGTLIVWTR